MSSYEHWYIYGSTIITIPIVTVAQPGLERSAFNRVVGGSNPPRDI